MAFDVNDIFQPLSPPDFPAVPGTTILSSQYNNEILDICDGLTAARAIAQTLGSLTIGKGISTSDVNLRVAFGRSASGNSYVDLVGDTTYTAYGLRLGRLGGVNGNSEIRHRGTGNLAVVLQEASKLTMSINGGSIGEWTATGLNGLPIGATTKSTGGFTTLATTGAVTFGSTLAVTGASTLTGAVGLGAAINEKQAGTVASAATTNLDTATGNHVPVSGSATITAFTLAEGREREVRFLGIATLVNSSNLILPGGLNIVTAVDDVAMFRGIDGGRVICTSYTRRDFPIGSHGASVLAAGTFSASTTTITIPSGTTKARLRLVIGDLNAASAFYVGVRLNGLSTGIYDYAGFVITEAGTDRDGANGANAFVISRNEIDSVDSNASGNVFAAEVRVIQGESGQDKRMFAESGFYGGAAFHNIRGACAVDLTATLSSISVSLAAGISAGGLNASPVTPAGGFYYLIAESGLM